MFINDKIISCDSCGRSFNTPNDVRNNIALSTPNGLVVWHDVCDGCSAKAEKVLRELFKGEPKVSLWRTVQEVVN